MVAASVRTNFQKHQQRIPGRPGYCALALRTARALRGYLMSNKTSNISTQTTSYYEEPTMNLDDLEEQVTKLEQQVAQINKAERNFDTDLEDVAEAVEDCDCDPSDEDCDCSDAEDANIEKRFAALVDGIARDDSVSRTEAMRRARLQEPDL